jgi:hypothetical protein
VAKLLRNRIRQSADSDYEEQASNHRAGTGGAPIIHSNPDCELL